MTSRLPARSCRSSTFWVTSVSFGTRSASAAMARCAGLGCACSTFMRRHSYQPHTSAGSRRNASGVARSAGSKRSHSPVSASRKVGMPLSADTPAPVKTTTWRALRKESSKASVIGMAHLGNRAGHYDRAIPARGKPGLAPLQLFHADQDGLIAAAGPGAVSLFQPVQALDHRLEGAGRDHVGNHATVLQHGHRAITEGFDGVLSEFGEADGPGVVHGHGSTCSKEQTVAAAFRAAAAALARLSATRAIA